MRTDRGHRLRLGAAGRRGSGSPVNADFVIPPSAHPLPGGDRRRQPAPYGDFTAEQARPGAPRLRSTTPWIPSCGRKRSTPRPLPDPDPRQALEQALRGYETALHASTGPVARCWRLAGPAPPTPATSSLQVRDKEIACPSRESLSGTQIRGSALPRHPDWGDIVRWLLTENVPGEFPLRRGVFPLKRTARTRPACSPARAARAHQPALPLPVSAACRPSACPRPSTR